MQDPAKSWLEASDYDLETARAMFESGRYLYVLFCCQQSIEKRLKALVSRITNEMPPRTHDLSRLANVAGLHPSQQQDLFLRRLAQYYIESRYPDEMQLLQETADRKLAAQYLEETGEVTKWLDHLLTQR
jgi:HEPN domain-containing protein